MKAYQTNGAKELVKEGIEAWGEDAISLYEEIEGEIGYEVIDYSPEEKLRIEDFIAGFFEAEWLAKRICDMGEFDKTRYIYIIALEKFKTRLGINEETEF